MVSQASSIFVTGWTTPARSFTQNSGRDHPFGEFPRKMWEAWQEYLSEREQLFLQRYFKLSIPGHGWSNYTCFVTLAHLACSALCYIHFYLW